MIFQFRLKELREDNKMSQEELGRKLGYSRTAISAYETGRNQPSYEDLLTISNIFGVSIDYLLGNTNDPTPPDTIKELTPKDENAQVITQIIVDTGLIPEGVNLSEEQKEILSVFIKGNATILKKLLQNT